MIWTILGFSVGIVAFFCIVVAETLVGKPVFEQSRHYIWGVFTVAGIVAWFVGRHLSGKKKAAAAEDEEGATGARFILFDLRYWGPMCVVLGVITLFIRPLNEAKVEVVAPVTPPVVKTAAVAVVETPKAEPPPKPPVVFPPLKMQGVIFREAQPYAIINGQSYAVGDHVGEVKVKAIERESVLLELAGEFKALTLN